MIIKKHIASTTKKALGEIMQEFGNRAFILSTSKVQNESIVYFAITNEEHKNIIGNVDGILDNNFPSSQSGISNKYEKIEISDLYKEEFKSFSENSAIVKYYDSDINKQSNIDFSNSIHSVNNFQVTKNDSEIQLLYEIRNNLERYTNAFSVIEAQNKLILDLLSKTFNSTNNTVKPANKKKSKIKPLSTQKKSTSPKIILKKAVREPK